MIRWLRSWGFTVLVVVFIVTAGTAVWAGYFSQWFALRSVVVTGNVVVSKEELVHQIAIPAGEPLLRVDLDEVRAHVEAIRVVASAQVSRQFPHTLRVEVVERAPVAYLSRPDGAHLVDKTGVDFEVVPSAPEGLPKLGVARAQPEDPMTKAALVVLTQLPDELRNQVVEVDAKSEVDVSAILTDNRVVVFGSSADIARKAQVALVLLSQPAQTYNVSYPNQPALSN